MNSFVTRGTTLILGLLILLGGSAIAIGIAFLWASSGRYAAETYMRHSAIEAMPPLPDADELTVVAYNLGYLSGLTNNQAVERTQALYDENLATAIAALQQVNPDILALQEVDLDAKRSFYMDQVKAIGQPLEYSQQAIAINWDKRYVPFPYWPPSTHFGPILSGQAILSRFTITHHERQVLAKVAGRPFYYNALYLDRLAQIAEVTVGDQTLVIINVHLEAFDAQTRLDQTRFVRQLAEDYAQRHPVLLLGDFNSALNRDAEGEPRTIQIMLESALLAPAVDPAQWTAPEHLTFPADRPQFKLDYIFYTPDTIELRAVEVLTAAAQASDHLPLVMHLRLR